MVLFIYLSHWQGAHEKLFRTKENSQLLWRISFKTSLLLKNKGGCVTFFNFVLKTNFPLERIFHWNVIH